MSNVTFNNISAISWWSVLLVEETRVPGENQRPAASHWQTLSHTVVSDTPRHAQALVSFKKYMPPPLPYFKVNICPVPLPHLALIFFAYLWSFRWPNYIVTLPRYFSFRLPHLNIPTYLRRIGQEYSAKVAFSIFQSLKRIQPLPVCAGLFICIWNSLDRPCVSMPSWSSPLKCKVSL